MQYGISSPFLHKVATKGQALAYNLVILSHSSADDYGDDYGLRFDLTHASTVVVAVVVFRSHVPKSYQPVFARRPGWVACLSVLAIRVSDCPHGRGPGVGFPSSEGCPQGGVGSPNTVL